MTGASLRIAFNRTNPTCPQLRPFRLFNRLILFATDTTASVQV